MTPVPNRFPDLAPSAIRVAVIGEAPSSDDVIQREPFASTSGRFLRGVMSSIGLNPKQCFFGNVCQIQPPGGSLFRFKWDGPEIQSGLAQLTRDLNEFKPNLVLCLGQYALRAAGVSHSIMFYRGTLFTSSWGYKALGCLHPAYCLRDYSSTPLFKFDIRRAKLEGATPDLILPNRTIITDLDLGVQIACLDKVQQRKDALAIDLEGYPDEKGVTCISLFPEPLWGFTLPFRRQDGTNCWEEHEELILWQKLCSILADPTIPKICQNAMYELFVFAFRHSILIRGVIGDTMLAHWEMFHELKKSLGLQTSIYTKEPYYKDERTKSGDTTHWEYCGKDSAVTTEIHTHVVNGLRADPLSYAHYQFNMEILKPYLYMSLRGCLFDRAEWQKQVDDTWSKIKILQLEVDELAGAPFNVKSVDHKKAFLYGTLKDAPAKSTPNYEKCLKLHANSLKLPPQYEGRGATRKITTNEEALLKLYDKTKIPILKLLLELVRLRTYMSDLGKLIPFEDNRIRSVYNPVGTVTGRCNSRDTNVPERVQLPKIEHNTEGVPILNWKSSIEMLGTNLQNQQKDVRNLFISDPDYDFYQYDLSGADAWTVACDLAALGHDKMLEHLKLGIKPSKNIILMQRYGASVCRSWSNQDWLDKQSEVAKDDKMYTCAKACQHGTNYGMKPALLRETIFKRSRGSIDISVPTAALLQQLYDELYQVSVRTRWIEKTVRETKQLRCASGALRRFTSIRPARELDQATLREALSHEPQHNTTYATNLALHNMYYDPENRTPSGSLIIQPLVMIHDALAGQWPTARREWAQQKMQTYFDNPLTIHGITLTIPVEGGCGLNWKDTE